MRENLFRNFCSPICLRANWFRIPGGPNLKWFNESNEVTRHSIMVTIKECQKIWPAWFEVARNFGFRVGEEQKCQRLTSQVRSFPCLKYVRLVSKNPELMLNMSVLLQNKLCRELHVFGVKFLSWKWCWCQQNYKYHPWPKRKKLWKTRLCSACNVCNAKSAESKRFHKSIGSFVKEEKS